MIDEAWRNEFIEGWSSLMIPSAVALGRLHVERTAPNARVNTDISKPTTMLVEGSPSAINRTIAAPASAAARAKVHHSLDDRTRPDCSIRDEGGPLRAAVMARRLRTVEGRRHPLLRS